MLLSILNDEGWKIAGRRKINQQMRKRVIKIKHTKKSEFKRTLNKYFYLLNGVKAAGQI